MSDIPHKRSRFLTAWAHAVCAHPVITLVVCLLLAAGSILLTVTRLQFQSDRSALVDPTLPWQQRYAEFQKQFPRWNDAVVVVDVASAPTPAVAEEYLAALESRLKADPSVATVTAGFPRKDAPAGLIYTQPIERVKDAVEQLRRTGPVLVTPSLDGLLGLSELGGTSLGAEQREGLRTLLEHAADVGEGKRTDVLGLGGMSATERLITPSGKLATVLVSLAKTKATRDSDQAVNLQAGGIAAIRGHIDALHRENRFSLIQTGVTGVPVLESDETTQSTRDASRASVISLLLITALMLLVYRGWAVPAVAVFSLLIGMCWSFAWATLAVGHLQVLSVTFASLLMGLGIDVAIHIIARLELVHPDHDHMAASIARVFRGVGPGIITASITVAAAAAAMAFTGFSGVGELGIIAAGGMILCTISIMCCLPAILVLMPRPERRLRTRHGGEGKPFMGRFGRMMDRHAGLLVASCVAILAGAGWLATGVRQDSDLQKLMPSGVESVVWENRLEADDARSVWHAVVLAKDDAEARTLTAKLRALPDVSDVAGVGMLYHPEQDDAAKRALLRTLPAVAEDKASGAEGVSALPAIAQRLAKDWAQRDTALAAAASRVVALKPEQVTSVLAAYKVDRAALREQVRSMREAEPVTPSALPQALKDLMVGSDGSLLLRVYPQETPAGESVLAPARLNRFAESVLRVAPLATGPTVQIFESTRLINHAYVRSGLYALGVIFLLLVVDFGFTRRGVLDTLCALLPVLAGAVLMLAWMRVFGIVLNFANMIVMPLIVGIGVGAGVHAVRRWRLQPNDVPLGLAGGSGRAIGLTTLTTIFGFAAMMAAEHRGVRSLGYVMSIGLAMVWAAAIVLLPAMLRLRAGRRASGPGAASAELKQAVHTSELMEVGV